MAVNPGFHPDDVLTAREHHVLQLLAQGLSNKEIAEQLTIADKTVECHLTHIFAKLCVKTRIQAALWAKQHLSEEDAFRGFPDVETTRNR